MATISNEDKLIVNYEGFLMEQKMLQIIYLTLLNKKSI